MDTRGRRLQSVAFAVVVAGWIISLVASIFVDGWTAPSGLNEAFTAIVLSLFTARSQPEKS